MKMFLRLGVFVFLSIAFLLVVGTADWSTTFPKVTFVRQFDLGDVIKATFVVTPVDSILRRTV